MQNGEIIKTLTLDKRIHKIEIQDKTNPIQIIFRLKSKKDGTCRFYLASLDTNAFYNSYEFLSQTPFEINKFEDGKISGTITLEKEGKLLITIPVLNGWTVYVDKQKADFETFCNAFYVLDLSSGNHSIEMSYMTPGFKLGCIISILGISLFFLIFYLEYKKRNISQ